MPGLLDRLRAERVLLADGAWGSLFIDCGLDISREPADVWNLRFRDVVATYASEYAACVDVLTTNTFGANRIRLSHFGLQRKLRKINRSGAAIAREAERSRKFLDRPLLIAGSMGPARGPDGNLSDEALFEAFREQAECLADSGVSFLLLETMTDLSEARIAVRAAKSAGTLDVVCSFAFRETAPGQFETWCGHSVDAALGTALDAGADLVGANCVPATESTLHLLAHMRRLAGQQPLWFKPNAGQPTGGVAPLGASSSLWEKTRRTLLEWSWALEDFYFPDPWDNRFERHYPNPFSDALLDRYLDELGRGVIGGCCGVTPLAISRLRRLLDRRAGLR